MSEQKHHRPARGGFSGFLAALIAFPSRVLSALGETRIGRFFTGYDATDAALSESRFHNTVRESFLEKRVRPFRQRLTNLFARSRVADFLRAVADMFRYTETRIYGALMFTVGIYTVIIHLIKRYTFIEPFPDQSALFTGIALIVFGLPLLFSARPLCMAVQESPLISHILYDVLEMRRAPRVRKGRATINLIWAITLGSALGLLGFFVNPPLIVGVIAAVVLFFLFLSSPEFCLFAAIFTAPFLIFVERPTFLLGVIVLIGAVSYFFKVLLGKRTFSFGMMDLAVTALALLYLSSCFFTFGGKESVIRALTALVLLLGYFLTANLLSSRRILRHAITTLTTSATLVAIIGLIQQIGGRAIANWLDNSAYDYIAGRITSVFENPNVLAVYLILVLPFTAAGFLQRGRTGGRMLFFLSFALCMGAIVYTWSRGAWLGVILSLALFLFACHPATAYLLIPALAAFPIMMATPIGLRLSSITSLTDSSISYRLGIWRGALNMAGDHILGGVGVGESAFRAFYPYYALSGIEGATHTHNLTLQLLCEFGIVGPLLFLAFLFLFFQCVLTHQKEETDDSFRLYSIAAACGVFAVLINGIFDYVFYNSRVFFLFFVVVGIAVALFRVGRTERARANPIYDRGTTESDLEIPLL